jgi:hypothetical protein
MGSLWEGGWAQTCSPGWRSRFCWLGGWGPRTGTWGDWEEKVAEHSSPRPGDLWGAASAGHLDQELQEAHPVWRRRQRGIPASEEEAARGWEEGEMKRQDWVRGNRGKESSSETSQIQALQHAETLGRILTPQGLSVINFTMDGSMATVLLRSSGEHCFWSAQTSASKDEVWCCWASSLSQPFN